MSSFFYRLRKHFPKTIHKLSSTKQNTASELNHPKNCNGKEAMYSSISRENQITVITQVRY